MEVRAILRNLLRIQADCVPGRSWGPRLIVHVQPWQFWIALGLDPNQAKDELMGFDEGFLHSALGNLKANRTDHLRS